MKQITKIALIICLISLFCALLTACGDEIAQQPPSDTASNQVAHVFGDWITIKEATCNEAGLSQRYCSECMYTESQAIKALGHDLIQHEAKSPICELAGHEAYETCRRCDYTSAYKEIPALKHTYDDKGFCTLCHDSEKFKIVACFEDQIVIGYRSAEAFAGMETLIIPSHHNGTRITHVGGDCEFAGMGVLTFRGLKNLKNVIISEGIEVIDWPAFLDCTQITSITFPKSIKNPGDTLFFSIPKLQDVYYGGTREEWKELLKDPCIPITVTVHCSDGDLLLEKATASTPGLEMKKKEDGTYECVGIGTCATNNIIISSFDGIPVTSIADRAFSPKPVVDEYGQTRYDHSYISCAVLGDSVVSVGDEAFEHTNLKVVHIGNLLTKMGDWVFLYCHLEFVYISDSAAEWNAFENKNPNLFAGSLKVRRTICCSDGEIIKE